MEKIAKVQKLIFSLIFFVFFYAQAIPDNIKPFISPATRMIVGAAVMIPAGIVSALGVDTLIYDGVDRVKKLMGKKEPQPAKQQDCGIPIRECCYYHRQADKKRCSHPGSSKIAWLEFKGLMHHY